MSTYYYMACDEHKKKTPVIVVERLMGSHLDNQGSLLYFFMKHSDCSLRFFSEYDDERSGYDKEAPSAEVQGGEK